ncbi:MAG: hypothetical protein GX432_06710 [Candidatus Atribacteria bacterium]|nr:hypothetical protein [Candidatus Atribacteria bacterium]
MNTIGLVVNPAAGKDIRRLVAHGSVFGNREKINYTIRILLGFEQITTVPIKLVYMPDPYELVETVIDEIGKSLKNIQFEKAPIPIFGDEADTTHFTQYIAKDPKVSALVVLGGDGTNRLVARYSRKIPLFSISAGTNNVFADNIEPTICGMALGYFINGWVKKDQVLERKKVLRIFQENAEKGIALVDVVLLDKKEIGARAVWDSSLVKFVVVTQTDSMKTGLSAIVDRVIKISSQDHYGGYVFPSRSGRMVSVAIAPGLVQKIGIGEWGYLQENQSLPINHTEGIIALDGERELPVRSGENWTVLLDKNGPVKANIKQIMEQVR